MPYIQEGPGCISFTLAGVPTLIRPSVWLVLLVLGSAGSANFSIVPPLVFMVMGVLCLLVHEYGHAFSCRALGGGESIVELGSLGGVTYSSYPPPTRATHIIMVLAGPGASLLLGLLGGFTLGLLVGAVPAGIGYSILMPLSFLIPIESPTWIGPLLPVLNAFETGELTSFAFLCYNTLFYVCVWWTLFNLLPIFPLDGSKTLFLITNSSRITGSVGLIVSLAAFLFCLTSSLFFTAFICAYFAYLNYQYLRTNLN